MKETIYLGAGCFWGVQAYFKQIKGIKQTSVGYLNGHQIGVSYEAVCAGSGHVEVVKILYELNEITRPELFKAYMHIIDPFALNRQGNDQGIQYRSGIYYLTQEQKIAYQHLLQNWEQIYGASQIEIIKAQDFTLAESYHQDYLTKNPQGYCHINLTKIPSNLKK